MGDAAEQIANTYDGIKSHLKLTNQYEMKAFLIGHHGTPPIKRTHENLLKQKFGANNYIYNGTTSQFPQFLRGEEVPLNNVKGKNKKRKKG